MDDSGDRLLISLARTSFLRNLRLGEIFLNYGVARLGQPRLLFGQSPLADLFDLLLREGRKGRGSSRRRGRRRKGRGRRGRGRRRFLLRGGRGDFFKRGESLPDGGGRSRSFAPSQQTEKAVLLYLLLLWRFRRCRRRRLFCFLYFRSRLHRRSKGSRFLHLGRLHSRWWPSRLRRFDNRRGGRRRGLLRLNPEARHAGRLLGWGCQSRLFHLKRLPLELNQDHQRDINQEGDGEDASKGLIGIEECPFRLHHHDSRLRTASEICSIPDSVQVTITFFRSAKGIVRSPRIVAFFPPSAEIRI